MSEVYRVTWQVGDYSSCFKLFGNRDVATAFMRDLHAAANLLDLHFSIEPSLDKLEVR